MSIITIQKISDFFNESGEPSLLGCNESDVERLVSLCESKHSTKGICTVKNWAIVDCEFDDVSRAHFHAKGVQPTVLHTNHVLWDKCQRWPPGSFASSSLLVSIEQNCLFITKNTVYVLVGEGHRKLIAPALLCAIQSGLAF